MRDFKLIAWTLRTWPKAQYLARAMGIPPDAWEIPYLFVPIGGPELSVFEAMEKPELGGLTARLKALTKPLAAAAYTDPWIRSELIGESKLAVAFHPGVDLEQVRQMCTRDGYQVLDMASAIEARGEVALDERLEEEGLLDGHARLRAAWPEEDIVHNTIALPVWPARHHSAAFYLASRIDSWPALEGDVAQAIRSLVTTDLMHSALIKRLPA